ncbi:hypothetical protein KEJ18_03560, partial [Candidatus Bathyarchaeota archaeon]|nr:hypothetical protein [Candidatus Bathyarchaeota archaeon]
MNKRERFLTIARFEKVDRVPVGGDPRKATLERWYNEGLPRDVNPAVYFKLSSRRAISSFLAEG